jgi:hypothetical protein
LTSDKKLNSIVLATNKLHDDEIVDLLKLEPHIQGKGEMKCNMQHPLLTMLTIDYCKNARMKETTKMANPKLNMYIVVGYMINKVFKFLLNIFLSFYILNQVCLQVFKK